MKRVNRTIRAKYRKAVRKAKRRKARLPLHSSGYKIGYKKGFAAGWNEGFASFADSFSGTSIIIPTLNRANLLKTCIESIQTHTAVPYEIIIVDNGSKDETVPYLKQLCREANQRGNGRIRVSLNRENLGFSGAANRGLMLAKGDYLLILNNDTVVTENWLPNLLRCVNSDPSIGIVGPVTNYISGDQQIPVSYESLEDMQRFASLHNHSDGNKWKDADRITGFCMLMRRDVFRRIGYFDEGFAVGNCEDDDYCVRAILCGLRLVIAADTFIHHVGSASVKSFGEQFRDIYAKNLEYYAEKWPDIGLLRGELGKSGTLPSSICDLYPTHVAVKDANGTIYWIEHGSRYPLQNPAPAAEAVPVSRIDLKNWRLAEPITMDHLRQKLAALQHDGERPDGDLNPDFFPEGMLAQTPGGEIYQWEQRKWRRICGSAAIVAWNLHERNKVAVSDEMIAKFPRGFPVISPLKLRYGHI